MTIFLEAVGTSFFLFFQRSWEKYYTQGKLRNFYIVFSMFLGFVLLLPPPPPKKEKFIEH